MHTPSICSWTTSMATLAIIWLPTVRLRRNKGLQKHRIVSGAYNLGNILSLLNGFIGVLQVVLLTVTLIESASATQFYNLSQGAFRPEADLSCISTVNRNISSCSITLTRTIFFGISLPLTPSQLDNICTEACLTSLHEYRTSLETSCGSFNYYDKRDNISYGAVLLAEELLFGYRMTCLKTASSLSTHQWNTDTRMNIEPSPRLLPAVDQQSTPLLSRLQLLYYRTRSPISHPALPPGDTTPSISQSQSIATHLLVQRNGLLSDLGNFTLQPGNLCIERTCRLHKLAPEETCESIGQLENVGYSQLLAWNNNINLRCSNLEDFIGYYICVRRPVPTSNLAPKVRRHCGRYHLVGSGDDCGTICMRYNINRFDLGFLNPDINKNCTNLWLKYYYCVRPVGDIASYPGHPLGKKQKQPIMPDPAKVMPKDAPDILKDYITRDSIIPLARGTRLDCFDYIWLKDVDKTSLSDCRSLAFVFKVDIKDLIMWNPSLNPDPSSCKLSESSSYCVSLTRATAAP
ncbi:hypothetical protein BJ508DRAFT_306879 [Ascobolus immersus RN42]|uniref:LysM domain-containing protein n=1 Tax=Ascobolus immersus RN42 TaxID=1160509 RepID=A0A3N4IAD2_ASCIM|nr:hypothetical protein BJ508DRAFT_306879 [Ascobolus immersus RN42]